MRMKIPTTGSGNGYYGHETSLGYVSDGSENGHQEELDSPTLDGDFSEYMWMEHEEEFDKQIMQQLEEEALMEHCFEAMLEDEREIRDMPYVVIDEDVNGETCPVWSAATGVDNGNVELSQIGVNLCDRMESLQVQDKIEIAKQSTLNPNAAEFVPQQRTVASQQEEKTS